MKANAIGGWIGLLAMLIGWCVALAALQATNSLWRGFELVEVCGKMERAPDSHLFGPAVLWFPTVIALIIAVMGLIETAKEAP